MSTTIKEEKLMKKITSLILAIVMMLSMTVVSVYAAENTMPLESVTDVASTYSTDDRNLAMFENERIYNRKSTMILSNRLLEQIAANFFCLRLDQNNQDLLPDKYTLR